MIDRLFWLLFSFRGRIGRADFAIFWFIQLAVWGIYQVALWRRYLVVTYDAAHKAHIALDAPPVVRVVMFFLSAVALWVSLAVQIKRLHDFNSSGWPLAAPIGGASVGGLLVGLAAALQLRSLVILAAVVFSVAGLAGLTLILMMFSRVGYWGDNGHPRGPDEDAAAGRGDVSTGSAPEARRAFAPKSSPPGFGRPGAAQTFGRRSVRP